jgi:hypothetical protein
MAKSEAHIVYGAWIRAIGDERQAIARFDEEKFSALLEDALAVNNGDVRSALASIKEAMIQKLRCSL